MLMYRLCFLCFFMQASWHTSQLSLNRLLFSTMSQDVVFLGDPFAQFHKDADFEDKSQGYELRFNAYWSTYHYVDLRIHIHVRIHMHMDIHIYMYMYIYKHAYTFSYAYGIVQIACCTLHITYHVFLFYISHITFYILHST